jgi:hypothetical protein
MEITSAKDILEMKRTDWNDEKCRTHESGRVCLVSADFVVHLDQPLVEDLLHLGVRQSVLEAISQKDHQRETFTQLVGTSAGARSEHTSQLVQHPMLGRC